MKTYQKLYQILTRETDYISGENIARHLGISRTSVWKAIQRLQQEGLDINSIKNKGYKLLSGDLILPKEIEEKAPIRVCYKAKTRSTQLDAKEGVEQKHPAPTLYLSTQQTAGRGRFQRPYYSPEQGGIYMTLHLQPNLPYEELPSYTLLVAAAIYQAVKHLTLIELDIKWVNDLYLNHKKVAGILTEAMTSVETGLVTDVMIGVGINFSIPSFPAELEKKATSLFHTTPPITRNELIAEIWNCFFHTKPEELLYLYQKRSIVLGKEVTFQQNGELKKGLARAITPTGQLIIELSNGKELHLQSGEVSLLSW